MMALLIRSLLMLLVLASVCLAQDYGSGIAIVSIQPAAPGGSGPTETIEDTFTGDATDWSSRIGATCSYSTGGGTLNHSGNGLCVYTGSTHGSQPTSVDQWAVIKVGTNGGYYRGPAVRIKSTTPGSTDSNYVVRCSTQQDMEFRYCVDTGDNGTLDCTTFYDGDVENVCPNDGLNAGDSVGIAVAGTGTSTELCGWVWDASVDSDPSDFSDPGTWGDADYCISDTGTISLLAAYSGATTNDKAWDADPGVFSNTYTDTGTYSGGTGDFDMDEFRSGEL